MAITAMEAIVKIYARDDACSEELFRSLYQYRASPDERLRGAAGRAWTAVSSCWLPERIATYVTWLADIDPGIRKAGVEMMGWIGPAASSAVYPLMEALAQETVEEIKEAIIVALAAIGAPPQDCIAEFMEFLAHGEALVRKTAAEVLGRLGPDQVTGELVDKLLEIVTGDDDPSVRAAAATALGRLLARAE